MPIPHPIPVTRNKKHAPQHGQVYAGCSAWAYTTWKPDFYPAAGLNAICTRLRARAASGKVFAYFKHEETPVGVCRALNLLEGSQRA